MFKWIAFAAAASLPIVSSAKADSIQIGRPTTVIIYEGAIDETTAGRFLELVGSATDTVIGLNVTVEPSQGSDELYYAALDENRLVVSSGDPLNAPREVVLNGIIQRTFGLWKVDGFYLIKSGGMHAAGALSWGAMPVDEATIRLNPNIQIERRPF